MRHFLSAALLLAAAAPPVGEAEPDTFSAPQAIGVLGPEGLAVTGTLDPTDPTGLAPGDLDGFSFTTAADGPLSATLDAGGGTWLLGLTREGPAGVEFLGAVTGPAPLVLSRPDLAAGPTYRVGVAALHDGSPLPYALSLAAVDDLPDWSGADLPGPVPGVEPDDSAATAADLGDFTGLLSASGSLSSAVHPNADEGYPGDTDTFRFRSVLPTAARLVFRADPGLLRVEFQQLVLVGAFPVLEATFGEVGEVALPPLLPGAEYLVQVRADLGNVPLAYTFFLEPAAAPPPAEPEPMTIRRATLRLGPAGPRTSFAVDAAFEPGLAAAVPDGASFSYAVRGAGEVFAEGLLRMDDLGRLRYLAPPGTPGLRSLLLDPFEGNLRLRGRGVDWGDSGDPGDPTVAVEVEVGGVRFGGEADGQVLGRRVLRVR